MGDVTAIQKNTLQDERKVLKRYLGVKSSTPKDLLYIELDLLDIMASIRDKQHKFFRKLKSLEEGTALVLDV